MYCKYCGHQLDEKAIVCPHCGILTHEESVPKSPASPAPQPQAQPNPQPQSVPQKSMNVLAIVGFVLSFFCSLAGLICSAIAMKQLKTSGESGKGFAVAGVVISSVAMGIVALYLIFAFSILGCALCVIPWY